MLVLIIMQHLGMVDIYYTGLDMNAEVGREEKTLSTVVSTIHQASVYYLNIYIYISPEAGASPQLISCFYAMFRCRLILCSAQIKVDKVIICVVSLSETCSHMGYVLLISSGVITHNKKFLK
jgi:hypothetical protein